MRAANDTVAAIATAPGRAGIGIVRISGEGVNTVAAGVLSRRVLPAPRFAARERFLDGDGGIIDDGIALYFPAPHSFTGQEVLELQGHGGVAVMQGLYERCLSLGARAAEPGEFTLRAYLNGKLDLAQAEGMADLINADSAAAARAAAHTLTGAFSEAATRIADKIAAARADIETALDFSDEDIAPPDVAAARLRSIGEDLRVLLEEAGQGAKLTAHFRVVIAGAANVGKSSLFNRLAVESAAIVTDRPGTTRDIISREIDLGGIRLHLADTAGIRPTDDRVESEGVARARRAAQNADLLLMVVDGAAAPTIAGAGRVLFARNKIDLTGDIAGAREGKVYLSAKTGAGVSALKNELRRIAGGDNIAPPFSARRRHLVLLKESLECLQNAARVIAQPEIAAAWLSDARKKLDSLTCAFDDEELLGEIFSKFCIGK